MSCSAGQIGLAGGGARRPGDDGPETSRDLLRYGHIFASAVNEVLGSRPLGEASQSPLTLSQLHLLALMCRNGEHQVGQVADFLGVSPPAATKNIDKLERLGLVVRKSSPDDRRATILAVSAKGRRLVRRYEELKSARLAKVMAGFQPAEICQFAELLKRFSISLLAMETAADNFCLRCAAYIDERCPVGELHGGCPYQKMRGARGRESAPEDAP